MLELLYDALNSPHGIVVSSEDPERLRQKLYPLRKAYTELAGLALVISPSHPETDLWILKKAPTDE